MQTLPSGDTSSTQRRSQGFLVLVKPGDLIYKVKGAWRNRSGKCGSLSQIPSPGNTRLLPSRGWSWPCKGYGTYFSSWKILQGDKIFPGSKLQLEGAGGEEQCQWLDPISPWHLGIATLLLTGGLLLTVCASSLPLFGMVPPQAIVTLFLSGQAITSLCPIT